MLKQVSSYRKVNVTLVDTSKNKTKNKKQKNTDFRGYSFFKLRRHKNFFFPILYGSFPFHVSTQFQLHSFKVNGNALDSDK